MRQGRKKVAALILNRNLPILADNLAEWMIREEGDLLDVHVIENGSDPKLYSKYASIKFLTSLGPAAGINRALESLLNKNYDFFWVNYNDVRFRQPGFLKTALSAMEKDDKVGMYVPYWHGNTWTSGQYDGCELLKFFGVLSFVVSRTLLDTLRQTDSFSLDPLWDSSNFSNHDNVLASLLTLYRKGFIALVDQKYQIDELPDEAVEQSLTARGYADTTWKHKKGPTDMQAWYLKAFPQLTGTPKEKRQMVIREIEQLIKQRWPDALNTRYRMKQLMRRVRKSLRIR